MHVFVGIEPCQSNPCKNKGTCRKSGNSYNCACSAGYTGLQCESMYASFICSCFFYLLSQEDNSLFVCVGLDVRLCLRVCFCVRMFVIKLCITALMTTLCKSQTTIRSKL